MTEANYFPCQAFISDTEPPKDNWDWNKTMTLKASMAGKAKAFQVMIQPYSREQQPHLEV